MAAAGKQPLTLVHEGEYYPIVHAWQYNDVVDACRAEGKLDVRAVQLRQTATGQAPACHSEPRVWGGPKLV